MFSGLPGSVLPNLHAVLNLSQPACCLPTYVLCLPADMLGKLKGAKHADRALYAAIFDPQYSPGGSTLACAACRHACNMHTAAPVHAARFSMWCTRPDRAAVCC